MIWAWTLIPQTLAQADVPSGKLFTDWRELAAMVLLGVGFVLLVGTLGAMWRGRWRSPDREVSSRLDQPTSLERAYAAPISPTAQDQSERAEARDMTTESMLASKNSPSLDLPARSEVSRTSPPRSSPSRVELPTPTVSEAQQLLATMNAAEDLNSTLAAQLEVKANALRELIAQADAKIAELERAARTAAAPRGGNHVIDTPAPAPLSPVVTMNRLSPSMTATAAAIHAGGSFGVARTSPEPKAPATAARADMSRAEPSRTAVTSPQAPMVVPSVVASDPTGPDPLTGEIYRLADQGMPAVEIARRLNQHVGKVELILALRPG